MSEALLGTINRVYIRAGVHRAGVHTTAHTSKLKTATMRINVTGKLTGNSS